MKIQLIVLSAALLVSATGCDKKAEPVVQSLPPENVPQKVQEHAEKTIPVIKAKQEIVKPLPVAAESSVKTATDKPKLTSEQILTDVTDHGREVTKTQVSKSRTRAQQAEDEMMQEVAQHK